MSVAIERILIGASVHMARLRSTIHRVAPTTIPVLIEGETGTGKELVATALHQAGHQPGALVPLNVCALGEALFESALFGHVRGAFTGAIGDAAGYLAEAHRGTLFLDEISGLALSGQVKLLRAVETKHYRPVGARTDRCSDFRVIAASNEDLGRAVAEGRFRLDLLQRLGAVRISVPPLRTRVDDIPLLIEHFSRNGGPAWQRLRFGTSALRTLQDYHWPGNVRELRHFVDTAAVFADEQVLTSSDVDLLLHREDHVGTPHRRSFEEQRLVDTLHQCEWDVERAAERLGVHRATIYRRIKRLDRIGPAHHRLGSTVAERVSVTRR